MGKNLKIILGIWFTIMATQNSTHAKIKITDVSYNSSSKTEGKVTINFTGSLKSNPVLTLGPYGSKTIQLAIDNAFVWPKINKTVQVISKRYDTDLMAYQYNKNLVRVRVILPYNIEQQKKLVSISLKDQSIEVLFPKKQYKFNTALKIDHAKKGNRKPGVEKYDELYLENLLKSKKPTSTLQTDSVPVKFSSILKKARVKKGQFSFAPYFGKFALFLVLVLALFYGIVHLMKKGVLNKGKLGFLNNSSVVQILNSTYLGPKRTLVLVKVHQQIFLLSNAENGINFLSEVSDTTSLIKTGEKAVTGDNFDITLDSTVSADKINENIQLKANPLANYQNESNSDAKVKFSDQIKKRLKELKPLQEEVN